MHEEHIEHPPWYQMPASTSGKVLHVLTFVLKGLVFTTTPNGAHPTDGHAARLGAPRRSPA